MIPMTFVLVGLGLAVHPLHAQGLPMPAALFASDDLPWEQSTQFVRRKVFSTADLTMVLFEVTGPSPAQIETHSHANEQITYVVEGRAVVRVADDEREIGPGSVYVAPANVPHGMRKLTDRFVGIDCFAPARADLRDSSNELRAFVAEWFSWFDRQADEGVFVAHLAAKGLHMRLPETTLQSAEDFKRWYKGIRSKFAWNAHDLGAIVVSRDAVGNYLVQLPVVWRAHSRVGQDVTLHVRQSWKVSREMDGRFVIADYVVSEDPK